MTVQESPEIAPLDERGELAGGGHGDLAGALPQLGGNRRESQRPVEGRFVRRRHEGAASPEGGAVERESVAAGVSREFGEVSVASRGLDQNGAGIGGSGHHDLGRGAAGEPDGDAALVLAGEFVDARQPGQPFEQIGGRLVGHQDDDQLAHHLGVAPDLAGHDRSGDARELAQRQPQRFRFFRGVVAEPVGAGLPQEGDAAQDVLRAPGAEPRQLGQPSVMGRRLELGERVDAEGFVDLTDLGDAEA